MIRYIFVVRDLHPLLLAGLPGAPPPNRTLSLRAGVNRHFWHRKQKDPKLHLGVDAGSGQIVAASLTEQDLSDESQVGPLLAQIQSPIEQLTADSAYDGEPTYRTIAAHDDAIAVVIPPRQDAVPSAGFETEPSPRDTHLLMISSLGRMRWQEITGYGQRALVETAMGRYKALIGERLRCRGDAARRTEAVVGAAVLNCMLGAARPNSVRRSVIQA